ncbi:pyridoxamine-phosphate oxidase [Tilletia horrida]|uniref:pyridoxal 5'-phosphate synthase n=1 Tax=Tilletia horrida TaxID=155126 RepID=A0AAN6JJS4_9BASI|nr:pyridoxamine-phosphate oxidase [Tilletia horrida]KAK0526962.1 pyridoxamine-phosphate oxidase [Tilletia horrida]KAK0529506.1 pyridoxamine-phosphate oxidase [Tilletia horrida]KAK0559805.1 pyridoxamine-phosphate oxidase [Tilletia horrida]
MSSSGEKVLDKVTNHTQYHTDGLDRSDLSDDPLTQFHTWFQHARDAGIKEPEAMTLATVSLRTPEPSGQVVAVPSSRIVLLKELDSRGFLFFTNYSSRKSAELLANPYASLTFYWEAIHRSVRVVGRAEQLEPARSDEYYWSRPRGSQLGAWASPQSQTIESRQVLEDRVREVEKQWDGKDVIQRPPFWGGWRIVPDEIEFWMGRESRLHDRFRYTRTTKDADAWKVERLGP